MGSDILIVAAALMILVGLFQKRQPWGKGLAIVGALILVVSLALSWPDVMEGFRDGYADHSG